MCGIVGGISERNIVPVILEGLSRLEYRGYDSVGVAIVDKGGKLARERCVNRVKSLIEQCNAKKFKGLVGIGHTRWATHGGVTETNAHPHFSNNTIALVHNGIIENYAEKREELKQKGYIFTSQTDTEVIVHLVYSHYIKNKNLLEAVKLAINQLTGAFAIGVINCENPHEIICTSKGAPLVIGVGINEMYFASDISALLPVTQKVVYLQDGDIAKLTLENFTIYDKHSQLVIREVCLSKLSVNATELGQYRHYMQKEIFEQPLAIADTLKYMGHKFDSNIFGAEALDIFKSIERIQIVACGTSYNAGCVAKYWFEEIAGIACSVDIASEYRYRKIVPNNKELVINISQSGETADTLACIKYIHELGMLNTLSICNVPESSLVRLSKLHILTQAGPEIGVASTKAFTTQLVVLLYLVFTLAKVRGKLDQELEQEAINNIRQLPNLIISILKLEPQLESIAQELKYKEHALFLGRHTMYPISVEGALKIKEISYIHAESYAAGELKHGPLSLIDKNMPVFLLMPHGILLDKVKSNAQEVLARQGTVYLITDSNDEICNTCHKVVKLDTAKVADYLLPIIYVVPLQLLAYHTGVAKGTDVDKPRNLAKSVTVE
ncbi:MAG: glutamine--fructose-6-phosphate transaminase (isomerizing) [Burkholderiales bacterium]|nr:glutamine--fructose-6-phosphate transaminase (isomerizing) [Burkholderiales bacterium]